MTISPAPKPAPRPKKAPKPITRSRIARSTTPIAPRNPRRAKRNHERAYGDYAGWIRRQPCCVCGFPRSEAAHTKNGGVSRKADRSTLVPLCGPHTVFTRVDGGMRYANVDGCHRTLHRGVQTFERVNAVDLSAVAAACWNYYQLLFPLYNADADLPDIFVLPSRSLL